MRLAQRLCLLLSYLPGSWVLFGQVDFISYKHDAYVLLGRVKQRLKPVFDIVEGLAICDVVNDEAAESLAIMCNGNCSVLFLPCCVP